MSCCLKPVVRIAFCASILSLFLNWTPGAAAEDTVAVVAAATELPAGAGSTDALVKAETPNPSNSTEDFRSMRADLAEARLKAASMNTYTAVLEMQEEVNGTLRPLDSIRIKVRQQPFSVYMRWNLLVKPVKGLAVLKRLWRLDPDCRMAKQSCRYPITDSGIENLVSRIQEFYAVREDWSLVADCSGAESKVADIAVTVYHVRFRDKEISPQYLGSRFCFDKITKLLIAVDNYGWSDNEEPRLLEHYVYHSITQDAPLGDSDFDETNPEFDFVER
jgi:hypothetical protein